MKLHYFFLVLGSIMSLSSCVNSIEDELQISDVPIRFTAKVSRPGTVTRVTGNSFDQGDKLGLFAVLESSTLIEPRYIDNLVLTYGENATLIPEREVFYPEGGTKLDFISYHPYYSEGMEAGKTEIPVKVETAQNEKALHSASDFLVATRDGVSGSENAVALTFRHKFAKIKIELVPQGDEDIDDMKEDNPKVVVTGFKTQAVYDFATDDVYNPVVESDIIPWGSWRKEGNRLVGVEAIVIPQPMEDGRQSFVLEWNGKVYTCPIPVLELEGNKQYTIQINAEQLDSPTLEGITASIEEWTDSETGGESNSGYLQNAVHVTALTFSKSGVYRVYKNGKAVAEICQEYLVADTLKSRAVVVYPVINDVTDLEKGGTVLKLLDVEGNVHGGTVKWNRGDNTINYTAGTSAEIDYFFIQEDGSISMEVPEASAAVSVSAYGLRDTRGGSLQTYPIVKIGAQYWMRTSLSATTYRDGTPLVRQIEMIEEPGYMLSENGKMYFYNGEALLAGELAPEGWRIPDAKEWNLLKSYVQGDLSVLKAEADWQELQGGEVTPSTNMTGLGLYPVGVWTSTHTNMYQTTVIWYFNEDRKTLPDPIDFINGDSNETREGTSQRDGIYKGFTVRCIKE